MAKSKDGVKEFKAMFWTATALPTVIVRVAYPKPEQERGTVDVVIGEVTFRYGSNRKIDMVFMPEGAVENGRPSSTFLSGLVCKLSDSESVALFELKTMYLQIVWKSNGCIWEIKEVSCHFKLWEDKE